MKRNKNRQQLHNAMKSIVFSRQIAAASEIPTRYIFGNDMAIRMRGKHSQEMIANAAARERLNGKVTNIKSKKQFDRVFAAYDQEFIEAQAYFDHVNRDKATVQTRAQYALDVIWEQLENKTLHS